MALPSLEATLMSATIFGGASQMVGIELFGQKIAPWLIVLSIFAVNFRHVLYSAAIGRRLAHWPVAQQAIGYFLLTDPQFAEAERKAEAGEKVGFAWYMGMAPGDLRALGHRELDLAPCSANSSPIRMRSASTSCCRSISSAWSWASASRPLWLPIVIASAVASVVAYKTIGSPWHVSVGRAGGHLARRRDASPQKSGKKARRRCREHHALDHPAGARC